MEDEQKLPDCEYRCVRPTKYLAKGDCGMPQVAALLPRSCKARLARMDQDDGGHCSMGCPVGWQ